LVTYSYRRVVLVSKPKKYSEIRKNVKDFLYIDYIVIEREVYKMNYLEGAEKFYDLFGEKDDVDFYLSVAKKYGPKALEITI
jgi:hypothetical protein